MLPPPMSCGESCKTLVPALIDIPTRSGSVLSDWASNVLLVLPSTRLWPATVNRLTLPSGPMMLLRAIESLRLPINRSRWSSRSFGVWPVA